MENRKFQIQPIGRIKGGVFGYEYDDQTQVLSVDYSVTTTVFFNDKIVSGEKQQAIAKEALKSSNFNRPGAPVHFAFLIGEVFHVANGLATANLTFDFGGYTWTGAGLFDVKGEYVALVSLNGTLKFFMISTPLVALPMQSSMDLMNSKNHTKV
jgi:hypothetical protein